MGKKSRTKGAAAEREVAKLIKESGVDDGAFRGRQQIGGPDSPDVKTSLPIHIEVKRRESTAFMKWYRQSENESGMKTPIVVHRKNGEEWMVYLKFTDFLKLICGQTNL